MLAVHGTGPASVCDFQRGDQRGIDPKASVVVTWDKAKDEFLTISKPDGLPF